MTIPHPSCISCKSKNCFILRCCKAEEIELIDKHKVCIHYKKGSQIFYEGSKANGIYLICDGKVKIFKEVHFAKNGVQIIGLMKTGDMLAYRCYDENRIYSISAAAIEDSLICHIDNSIFMKILITNSKVSYYMIKQYAVGLKNVETKLINMAKMTVIKRIAEAILWVKESYGVSNIDNKTLNVELSRQEIADIAGTAVDLVVRMLTEFEKKNLISKRKHKIKIMNEEKLKEITELYS